MHKYIKITQLVITILSEIIIWMKESERRQSLMNKYITWGIANNLPNILQHQLWQLVSEREQEQTKDNTSVDYFHIFQFNKHRNQLYIKHKQERPEYAKIHKANYSKAININKVYIIREDECVDLSIMSCYYLKNTRGAKLYGNNQKYIKNRSHIQ